MYISKIKKLFKIMNNETIINHFFHGQHQKISQIKYNQFHIKIKAGKVIIYIKYQY